MLIKVPLMPFGISWSCSIKKDLNLAQTRAKVKCECHFKTQMNEL